MELTNSYYRFYKILPLDLTLSQINPVHTLKPFDFLPSCSKYFPPIYVQISKYVSYTNPLLTK
jgi:hypothetical protein